MFPSISPLKASIGIHPKEKGADPSYDAEAHKDRIFGGHVKEYMEMLQEDDANASSRNEVLYIQKCSQTHQVYFTRVPGLPRAI